MVGSKEVINLEMVFGASNSGRDSDPTVSNPKSQTALVQQPTTTISEKDIKSEEYLSLYVSIYNVPAAHWRHDLQAKKLKNAFVINFRVLNCRKGLAR